MAFETESILFERNQAAAWTIQPAKKFPVTVVLGKFAGPDFEFMLDPNLGAYEAFPPKVDSEGKPDISGHLFTVRPGTKSVFLNLAKRSETVSLEDGPYQIELKKIEFGPDSVTVLLTKLP